MNRSSQCWPSPSSVPPMSKRIARIIDPESTRLHGVKKPAIGNSLPDPEDDQRRVHQHEDEDKKKIQPMKKCQRTDGVESGVVAEEIPAADKGIKMFPISDAIVVADLIVARSCRKRCLDVGMQSDEPALDYKVKTERGAQERRHLRRCVRWNSPLVNDRGVGAAMIIVHPRVNGCRCRRE